MTLEPQLWKKLQVELTYTYADEQLDTRTYKTLHQSRSWTDEFHSKFFEETRLPCTLILERARIHPSRGFYFQFSANYSACHRELEGILLEEPKLDTDKNISVDYCYKGDFQNCRLTSKRRIIGERRQHKDTSTATIQGPVSSAEASTQAHGPRIWFRAAHGFNRSPAASIFFG